MKAALLIAVAALGLAGCSTTQEQGGTGPSYEAETTQGRSMHFENDLTTQDPEGAFHNWRYGGDPDVLQPRLPVNPKKEELNPPPVPPPPQP